MHTNEGIIRKTHPHWIGSLGGYFVGIIFIIAGVFFTKIWPAIFLGIVIFFLTEIVRRAETYYVLEGGVAREYKLLSTSRKFAEYEKLQNIEVSQSFLENLLGIGDIKFDTAGEDSVEVKFLLADRPYAIEKIVREKMAVQ